jgi:hypothetical protein
MARVEENERNARLREQGPMSGWFEHRHYWLPKTALNTIRDEGKTLPSGGFIVEACQCGAVRQIEFRPGEAPKIFIAKATEPK